MSPKISFTFRNFTAEIHKSPANFNLHMKKKFADRGINFSSYWGLSDGTKIATAEAGIIYFDLSPSSIVQKI